MYICHTFFFLGYIVYLLIFNHCVCYYLCLQTFANAVHLIFPYVLTSISYKKQPGVQNILDKSLLWLRHVYLFHFFFNILYIDLVIMCRINTNCAVNVVTVVNNNNWIWRLHQLLLLSCINQKNKELQFERVQRVTLKFLD